MRLTHIQKQIICESAAKYFGADAQVWLFGSRVDDESKGGVYIESQSQDAAGLISAKLQFLRECHKKIGEQKIDVVLRSAGQSLDLPIYWIARQNRRAIAMTETMAEISLFPKLRLGKPVRKL